jgi:DNA-binding IclR family transcriptional regulator
MRLLRAVAQASESDSTAARLAEACDLNRATAWRLLSTLEEHGMVSVNRETGRWAVGVAVVEIARSAGLEAVVASARHALERLCRQTGETAALAVLRNDGLTYVDEVTPTAIVAATWLGRTVPLHATSTGKVVLAFGEPRVAGRGRVDGVDGVPGRRLQRHTDTTITDAAALEAELEATRERGFAVCRGEYDASAWGVSAPVLDRVGRLSAVLSIWGPGNRLTEERFEALGALAREAATEILRR